MKKKHRKRLKRQLTEAITKWADVLGLRSHWKVHGTFDWSGKQFKKSDRGSWQCTLARCYVDWPRMEMSITFNMPRLVAKDPIDLELLVIHELLHGMTSEMEIPSWIDCGEATRLFMKERVERVVTNLEMAVWWAYQEGKKDTDTA